MKSSICRSLTLFLTFIFLFLSPPVLADDFVDAVSQHPTKMKIYFSGHQVEKLLKQYKPEVYVDKSSFLPMSFYSDYLPSTVIKDTEGQIILKSPTKIELKNYADSKNYYLDYQPEPRQALEFDSQDVKPTYYGRIYSDTLEIGNYSRQLLFLKYSAVFPYSGLAARLSWWKNLGSHLIGDPLAWHELDIHGAVYVILDKKTCQPLGTILSQHNHHRVHWREKDFNWPDDNKLPISYAKYSNEPYLISGRQKSFTKRSIGNPDNLAYLHGHSNEAPIGSGNDLINVPGNGAKEVNMSINLLPKPDPLYSAKMSLGDRKKLFYFWDTFYREGPPGINFYASPELLDLTDLTAFYDIEREDQKFWELYDNRDKDLISYPGKELIQYQRKQLKESIQDLINNQNPTQSKRPICRLSKS